jgi:hypothetical protein
MKKSVWLAAVFLLGQTVFVSLTGAPQPPQLNIIPVASGILISWPASASGYVLETTSGLGTNTSWSALRNDITISGSNYVLSVSGDAPRAFYRLHNIGEPILAPERTWTFVPLEDAFSLEGEALGMGVSLATNSHKVLIFLTGGGACWDDFTCYTLNSASLGPFGPAQFAALTSSLDQAWVFNRQSAANPFKDYSYVYVPYCTGDLMAGSRVNVSSTHTNRHVGYQNMTAFLRRLVPTFSNAERIILAGSSAGGYAATFNWRQTQEAFGGVRVDLINDSGPLLAVNSPTGFLSPTAVNNWDLPAALPEECTSCSSNLGSIYGYYAAAYPNQRAAFLSFEADQPLASFYGISQSQFTASLNEFLASQINPHPNFRHFVASGSNHTMLTGPVPTVVNGVSIADFLGQMLTDNPAWSSVRP